MSDLTVDNDSYPVEDPEILTYFEYTHLPEKLQNVSANFGELARDMAEYLPDGMAREKMFEHLLYAKDWAVRAALPKGKSHV